MDINVVGLLSLLQRQLSSRFQPHQELAPPGRASQGPARGLLAERCFSQCQKLSPASCGIVPPTQLHIKAKTPFTSPPTPTTVVKAGSLSMRAAPTASTFFCFHVTWSAVSAGQTFCLAL